jgi:hypothetical protein
MEVAADDEDVLHVIGVEPYVDSFRWEASVAL